MSKENHKKIESKKFANEVKIATYFALFTALSDEFFIRSMNIDPKRGMKVMADNIGKFIKLKLSRLIIWKSQRA